MYSFKNDYSEGAHPNILNVLFETNFKQTEGYGEDIYTEKAVELLKQKIGQDNIDIYFFSGGTQTNLTSLSAFLRPYEAVVAANTGHILSHETGAIEATGHKIISIKSSDGKIYPDQIKIVLDDHTDEHMVKPKIVYISNSSEIGTIYKKRDLEELGLFCKKNNLLLYMDGARLGSALCSEENDIKLSDLGSLVDAFYIGGTKNGALLGEALVICRESIKSDFRYHMKQRGALLAKGRILGIQFIELFKNDLYFTLAQHANKMAAMLRDEISKLGFKFLVHSSTNQVFPILPNKLIAVLQTNYTFHVWGKIDKDYTVIRLVTSWATREEAIIALISELKVFNSTR